MTAMCTFQYEDELRHYKWFTYNSGYTDDKAREFEYQQILNDAENYSHEINAKLIDVEIIYG